MKNQNKNFALVIGVGGPNIEYTVNDAKKIREYLLDKDLIGYPEENVIVLTEEEVTRQNILDKFEELQEKTDEDATILLYYSGHGARDPEKNKYFMCLHDNETLSADDLRDRINALPSNKLVFFLDCCHAEGLVQSGISGLYGMAQKLNEEQGIWIVASCQDNQQSFGPQTDKPEEKNSFFTEALLEVLSGRHKRGFTDPEVSIMDVVEHIFEVVPERASEWWVDDNTRCQQTPYFKTQMSENLILSYFPKNAEDHEAIIAELEPNLEALDEDSFIRLIKSMEAVGRVEDAITALNKNKRTKTDPDLMEALGDLYRNHYLKHRLQKEGEEALELYKKAHELAVRTEDEEQVFTNAVKVAFMLGMLDLNKKEMREYALRALSAADQYVYNSVPKYVTMAEASIYLGDLEASKKHYTLVHEKAGIRFKMQCYERAYLIYNTLFDPRNEEDPYILFLKDTLLT
jgi:hypothetical protein